MHPLDYEVFRHRYSFWQLGEVHRHPDIVADVFETVCDEAPAEVGWAHRGSYVPGAGDPV
jgi:hypothetical protein